MSSGDVFNDWLVAKMQLMNLDEDVYASYIKTILDGEDSLNEKVASIRDLISETSTADITGLCEEMCERYIAARNVDLAKEKKDSEISIERKLAFIMEKQAQSIQKVIKTTKSEKELKDAILAQYAEVSDDEDDPNSFEEYSSAPVSSTCNSIPQNTNVHAVINAEKDLREKAKAEYENKKAQDKLNKEKQKQKLQERKEKERKRTQKQEHRR